MFERTKGSTVAVCSLLIVVGVHVGAGCTRQPASQRADQAVQLSTVTNLPSENLAQLMSAQPFRAEVLLVIVEKSTNVLADHGFKGRPAVITNHYLVYLRVAVGRDRIFRGVNVRNEELGLIGRLEKGKTYTFPEALMQ